MKLEWNPAEIGFEWEWFMWVFWMKFERNHEISWWEINLEFGRNEACIKSGGKYFWMKMKCLILWLKFDRQFEKFNMLIRLMLQMIESYDSRGILNNDLTHVWNSCVCAVIRSDSCRTDPIPTCVGQHMRLQCVLNAWIW